MNYRTLGRTGLSVSQVSLGGAYLMGSEPDQFVERTRQVVQRAAVLGINYIDTAPLYGKSEILLGEALHECGLAGHFQIASKVGYDPADFDYRRDNVLWSLERSLQRLRIDQLTIAQIHEVNMAGWERIMEPGGTLEGLQMARERGLCRFIGITGRAIPLLAQLADTGEFDTLLVYHDYHPCSQLAAEQVLPAAARQQMGVVIGTPLAGGLFADAPRREAALAALQDEAVKQKFWQWYNQVHPLPGSIPQHAYRWILTDPRVNTVSSGAANVAELEEVVASATVQS